MNRFLVDAGKQLVDYGYNFFMGHQRLNEGGFEMLSAGFTPEAHDQAMGIVYAIHSYEKMIADMTRTAVYNFFDGRGK